MSASLGCNILLKIILLRLFNVFISRESNPKAWYERDASNRGRLYFEKKGISMRGFIDVWPERKLIGLSIISAIYNPILFLNNAIFKP
jgi:hypothetical protein